VSRAERREFVVVGSGLLGLAAARALGERGRDVVCLEQEHVGNERSGSRGSSRIFRLGYDDPLYVAMASRAEQDWRALEAACGERLLEACSLLNFGEGLPELMTGMSMAGGSCELVDADEVAARFPGIAISGPAVLDLSAGVLRADRVLAALCSTMRAELRENVIVTGLADDGRMGHVRTTGGPIEASAVIVCAGAGSRELLRTAGIECRTVATLEQVAYFGSATEASRARSGDVDLLPAIIERVGVGSGAGADARAEARAAAGAEARAAARAESEAASRAFPAWADRQPQGESTKPWARAEQLALYGLPSPGTGWYKLGIHHTGPVVDPHEMSLEPDPAVTMRLVRAATSVLREIDPVPRLVERCIYDNTADEHFVIDRVGRIVIGAGTSGHGFKFGPLLGSLLADLATGTRPTMPLDRFSARRSAMTGS